MYLTRFEINTARRGARFLLASPQRLHAAVHAGFPTLTAAAPDEGRLLWRLDRHDHTTLLYIVSPQQPDLTHLVEQAGWPTLPHWESRDYQPLLSRLAAGQRWAFRLAANPVASRRKTPEESAKNRGKANTTTTEKPPHSQRFGHVTVAQQTSWLLDRTERHGFVVPKCTHDEPDIAVHRRETLRFDRQGATVTLATAVFEGHLDVTDPNALRRALTCGIGAGKAYGCGLLTLAPVI